MSSKITSFTGKYKRKPGIIFKEIEDLVYILRPETMTMHSLNYTASFIWKKLVKPLSLKQLVKLVCSDFNVSEKQAVKDCQTFLQNFLKNNSILKISNK